MNYPDCVFCEIALRNAPATIVDETSDCPGGTLTFVPLYPVTPGHLLIIPKVHWDDALQDPDITAMVMKEAAKQARRPCNLITSAGHEATQTVYHFHVHIVPRREGDGLVLPWTNQVSATNQ